MVTHLHGGQNPGVSDGNPDAWWTGPVSGAPFYLPTGPDSAGPLFCGTRFQWPNARRPTTLWVRGAAPPPPPRVLWVGADRSGAAL